jgi:uncharacterized protein
MRASREFQVFAKPFGASCNLDCRYCYYLEKERLYPGLKSFRMSEKTLETYIVQHIAAFPGRIINFSWHGGEPTMLGIDYFRNIAALQRKHLPPGKSITNGLQTNGTLIDDDWCRFFAAERFSIGISLDGPAELHDLYRVTKSGKSTHAAAMRGYNLLRKHRIPHDILCVVNSGNARYPAEVYRFFKEIGARYIGFLPLTAPSMKPGEDLAHAVPTEVFGAFLCAVFDEWLRCDIGRIKVQIIEEALRTAFGQEHSLCVFRKTCGDIPVIEFNGDFFSCDHFVTPDNRLGNIHEGTLTGFLESPAQKAFGKAKWETLPAFCRNCDVLDMCNGGCPKDRILRTPTGEPGLSCLCAGYKRFFTHCRPFVGEVAALWQKENRNRDRTPEPAADRRSGPAVGRNTPCPCGSGRKYKKCCLGKIENSPFDP